MAKERLIYFDLLKLFAIFLVIWGHCDQHLFKDSEMVLGYVLPFHMPLFMMVSGYFSSKSMSMDFKDLLKKKSVQLLLPWFCWSIFLFILHPLFFRDKEICYTLGKFGEILSSNFLWFLKSLFVCYILAFVSKKNYILIGTLLGSQLCSFLSLWFLYPAFIIGLLLRKNNVNLGNISLMGGAFLLYIAIFIVDTIWLQSWVSGSGYFLIRFLYRCYRVVEGIIASLFYIMFFAKLFKKEKGSYVIFQKIGKETLGIYILQVFLLEILLKQYLNFNGYNPILYYFVISPILSGVIILCSYGLIKMIGKSRKLSIFLLGK